MKERPASACNGDFQKHFWIENNDKSVGEGVNLQASFYYGCKD